MMDKKIITTNAIAGILLLLLAVLPASATIYATSVGSWKELLMFKVGVSTIN